MAVLKKKNEVARSKTISLPEWLWDVVESEGNRSAYVREILEKHPEVKSAKVKAKAGE